MRGGLHQRLISRALIATCAIGAWSSCVAVEAPDVTAAYDPPLRVIRVSPSPDAEEVARDVTFTVAFNTYLNAELLTDTNGLSLTSGGLRAFGVVRYRMVDRALVWTTTRAMEPDLVYALGFDPEVLVSVTGRPLEGPSGVPFRASDRIQGRLPEPEPVVWSDIAAELSEACDGCHSDPSWMLSPIRPEALIGAPSEQAEGQVLVVPFEPSRSYLMHKILWDYPLREGSAQPPPWSGAEQLSLETQRKVEAWIRNGARE